MIATAAQEKDIKSKIQTELTKRGFHAKILTFSQEQGRDDLYRFVFETEEFQTQPVLFDKIVVANFSSSIKQVTEITHALVYEFWIAVHVRYNHFEGGTNSSRLFSVNGRFVKGADDVFMFETKS